ncbi:hypothetical protein JTB14_013087 [Gonioctena quinquepunctata]|nr:hypothetical protein JTB14_013087 [Gonioctena quinquepunctata]
MLQTKLEAQNYTFKLSAIELAFSFSSVCVIGEDVDSLGLLTAKAREIPNVYFRKPGLKCSGLCLHCTGTTSCENILDQIVIDDDNAEDAENVSDQIQDDEDQTDNAELAEYGDELMITTNATQLNVISDTK